MKLIDKLAYLGIKHKQVLVTRSHGKSVWYIPGGKREVDETDHEALIREVREELSVELIPDTIAYYGTFEAQADGKPEGVMVKMTCFTGGFQGEMRPATEIDEAKYVNYAFKENTAVVDHLIFDDLKVKGYLD